MSLVEAFRFPFYRIFFSVVVGIIALEGFILSYNYNEDRKITDGVLIRIIEPDSPQELPLPGQIEIPFAVKKFKESNSQGAKFDIRFSKSTESITPKFKFTGGFVIKSGPVLVLENRPDIVIGKYWLFLKFKKWNIITLAFYLIFVALIGEILCTIGELAIGILLFNFNPFDCEYKIENCSIKSTPIISLFHLIDAKEKQLEFSELHYTLSRLYSGLAVSLIIIFSEILINHSTLKEILMGLCMGIFCFILVLSCLAGLLWIILDMSEFKFLALLAIVLLLASIVITPFFINLTPISVFIWFIFLMILSVILRIQANRILIHKSAESDKET